MVAAAIRTIFAQPDTAGVVGQFDHHLDGEDLRVQQ
jgi:hypothetical protein